MTNFELIEEINFDNSYENVLDFETPEAQDSFFTSKVYESFDNFSIIRENEEIKIEANINSLNGLNYCRYTNTIKGVEKTFYAFIIRKEYVNPVTTRLVLEVDVWQTYLFDFELKDSFVEREHQNRFIKTLDNKLLPVFNTEVENLEIGTDYEIISKEKIKDKTSTPDDLVWLEIIATQSISTGTVSSQDPSSYENYSTTLRQNGVRTGVYSYLIPVVLGQLGGIFWTPDATGTLRRLNVLPMENLVASSNAVLAIRILHYCPVKYTCTPYTSGVNSGYKLIFEGGYVEGEQATTYAKINIVKGNNTNFGGVNLADIGESAINLRVVDNTNENSTVTKTLSSVIFNNDLSIDNLKNVSRETKLLTYPFAFQQLCDYQSSPLKIKNEFLSGTHNIKFIQSLGISSKFKYFVENYNGDNGKEYNTINNTISELPLTNSAYISYISANKASATTGVALNVGTGLLTLGLGVATGGIGLVAGVGGAISSANSIANRMLKMQDLKNTPDNIRQAGNNAEFDILDKNFQLVLTNFRIKQNYLNKVFNYFYHFGYATNEIKKPNLKSRYYFNFIKTVGCNIQGSLDNEIIAKLKNIFNNGVAIWHFRDADKFKGILNFDYENVEISLI